ncbi:MAG: hypothetical protein WC489_03605 [Patescibacteria group bacterium]
MTILGLVAMPKAGKGVVVEALKAEGWTHISMSGVLLKHMIQDGPSLSWLYTEGEDPQRPSRLSYFNFSSYYRQNYGPGILSQWCMEEISQLPEYKREKIIIDGLRHPGEMDYLKHNTGSSNVYFWGIRAHENDEEDYAIRLQRFQDNPHQRGEAYETIEAFNRIEQLENTSFPTSQTCIGECFKLLKQYEEENRERIRFLINDGTTPEEKIHWQYEVRKYAREITGVSHHLEAIY